MKLLASLVGMHSHSPGDANQGEDYPQHLREVINHYETLMQQPVDASTPTVSAENYVLQDSTIGIPSPIGLKTNASPRSSTRAGNLKLGIPLVERSKTG